MDQQILNELAQMLDVERDMLKHDLELASCQWDSISAVQFIVTADLLYDTKIDPVLLEGCLTVGDLLALLPALPGQ